MSLLKDEEMLYELLKKYEQNVSNFVDAEDFHEEVMRFKFVFKILRRYENSGQLNTRLLLNHLIILHNIFDTVATKILLDGVDDDLQPYMYSALKIISRLPIDYYGKEDQDITQMIQSDILTR
tara:strand:- start:1547 stop:1915 length:369 start_codon:yes stop_codon:yes gene_type:complete